jgi:hypothetical protein
MTFDPIPSAVPGMAMWKATRDNYSFIVSVDFNHDEEIAASVKRLGATPFDGGLIELGRFGTIQDAMMACQKWRPQ